MGESLLWSVGMLKGENMDGVSYINRTVFHESVKIEVSSYIDDLKNSKSTELREKFITKMDFIARVDEEQA